jgi:hypothetical protein
LIQPRTLAQVRDPHARWCGRGGTARCPPIPIIDPKRSLTSPSLPTMKRSIHLISRWSGCV